MMTYGLAYAITAIVFLALDLAWLSTMNRLLYQPLLGPMLLAQFRLVPATIFYALYIFGIVFLAIGPALSAGRWQDALVRGAVLGLVSYATYDLTNQATLKGWPDLITVVDLCWGTFATAAAAVAGYLLTSALLRA